MDEFILRNRNLSAMGGFDGLLLLRKSAEVKQVLVHL